MRPESGPCSFKIIGTCSSDGLSYSLIAILLYFNSEMKSTITFLIMRKIKPRDAHHHNVPRNVSSRGHFCFILVFWNYFTTCADNTAGTQSDSAKLNTSIFVGREKMFVTKCCHGCLFLGQYRCLSKYHMDSSRVLRFGHLLKSFSLNLTYPPMLCVL